MAPRLLFQRASATIQQNEPPAIEFSAQWKNPSDVFSVLLILGGDVINRALAQLAGSGICPVAFSFGWVAYAISAVSAAVGENRLMPEPDCTCKVINAKSRYERENTSWIIGRVVRDFESWRDPKIGKALDAMLEQKWIENKQRAESENPGSGLAIPKPSQGGLCVSIYQAGDPEPGHQGRDMAYWSGLAVAVLQLAIAAIPCGIWGRLGHYLDHDKTFVLVRGNGSQHAIVIRCHGRGLDLEDLAAGPLNVDVHTTTSTRVTVVALAFLWIALLITASGIQENTWFLLAVGGLGILQNLFAAGQARDPAAFGMPLIFENVIVETKAMNTLYKVEEEYPGVGRSMVDTFFPGHLRPEEKKMWEMYEAAAAASKRLSNHNNNQIIERR
ncbi:hypothetical protein N7493_002314 [Penicillium malachiteum]|uniref:Uncharacterized protein n=1 Tax=Penicillium malachiteum TaxID=1324776 RepID=A0AAD6MYH6_9EURO|nr:hypothetical protein N7493_002314 [Penicillium malachiteum]